MLSKTWFFRLSAFAFIVLMTPVLGVTLHSPGGFLIIVALAVLVGLFEDLIRQALRRVYIGIMNNKLLFLFAVWYALGAIVNLFFGGNGWADWRLMIRPTSLIIGILFAFVFMTDNVCWRYFQIAAIIALGFQSIVSIPQLYFNPGIAREMWDELSGSWIYGDQSYFALCAILLPVFFWRSFKETGYLRLILLLLSTLILISAAISSFGTPIGLMIIGVGISLVLSLFMIRKSGWIFAIVIIIISYYTYQFTANNTLFSDAYTRIENFINDPTSGGYSGSDLDDSRWYLNEISIASFQANPLFGMGGGSTRTSPFVGGHSSMFDSLGVYGLFGGGGAFIGLIIVLFVNAIFAFLRERTWFNLLVLTTVSLLLVAGIVNPYWEGMQPLFVILIARPFLHFIRKPAPVPQAANSPSFSSTDLQPN